MKFKGGNVMRMNLLRRALVLALCAALVMGVAAQGAGAEGVGSGW